MTKTTWVVIIVLAILALVVILRPENDTSYVGQAVNTVRVKTEKVGNIIDNAVDQDDAEDELVGTENPPTTNPEESQQLISFNGYETYTPETLEQALKAGNNVALFFRADRSPNSIALGGNMETLSAQIPEGTNIFRINFDLAGELTQKYDITNANTVIYIDSTGKEIKRYEDKDKILDLDGVLAGFSN